MNPTTKGEEIALLNELEETLWKSYKITQHINKEGSIGILSEILRVINRKAEILREEVNV